jgi:hypothetical protein
MKNNSLFYKLTILGYLIFYHPVDLYATQCDTPTSNDDMNRHYLTVAPKEARSFEDIKLAQAIMIDLSEETGIFQNLDILGNVSCKLDLSDKNVQAEDIKRLHPYAGLVTDLDLSENYLGNETLKELCSLKKLKVLNLCQNSFDDEGMQFIGQLTDLISLNIVHNKVTATGVGYLSNLADLQIFNASCTFLGNEGICAISRFINHVRNLDVHACGFDETVLDEFLKMPRLENLNVSRNRIGQGAFEAFLKRAQEKNIKVKADNLV